MITLYGIPNCGSVRKGLDWFKTHNVEVVFHTVSYTHLTLPTIA